MRDLEVCSLNIRIDASVDGFRACCSRAVLVQRRGVMDRRPTLGRMRCVLHRVQKSPHGIKSGLFPTRFKSLRLIRKRRSDFRGRDATPGTMLFILILSYLGVWACAYAAVHSWRGRFAFWVLYVLSVTCVPLLSGISLKAIFNAINPDYGATDLNLAYSAWYGVGARSLSNKIPSCKS